MRRHRLQSPKNRSLLLLHWRGYPLYIIYIYLRGQLMLTLPGFLVAILFNQIITQVPWYDLIGVVGTVVGVVTAVAYFFYHRYSPAIRSLLAALIAGKKADQDLATRAWIESLNFSPIVVSRTVLVVIFAYTVQTAYFLLFTEFGLDLIVQGTIICFVASVAVVLAFFLFYLERMMHPISYVALAAGARADLNAPSVLRFRLRIKLLMLIFPVMIVPLVALGLFSYSQTVILGGDPEAGLFLTGGIVLASSGVAVVLAVLLVRSVLTPLQDLRRVMDAVAGGDLTARVLPLTSDELADLGTHLNEMTTDLAEQDRIKTAFGRYVSSTVCDGILNGQIKLGGERREVTIVFTDIRDFTAWCERTPPEQVIQTLNAYFDNLVRTIAKHQGTITRYTGDGVLALFGAPLDDAEHALHAVEAALETQEFLAAFNQVRHEVGAFELRTGFGIHTGVAVIGSIGCEARAEYTPIGDPANVASRIEGLNRELGTTLLISDATYRRIADRAIVGKTAETPVKGRVEPVRVFEVLGLREGTRR